MYFFDQFNHSFILFIGLQIDLHYIIATLFLCESGGDERGRAEWEPGRFCDPEMEISTPVPLPYRVFTQRSLSGTYWLLPFSEQFLFKSNTILGK